MKKQHNEKGFVLVAVLAITLLVMILGTAALKMSEMGYLAYGSEKRYNVAHTAAEFGLNTGIKYVVDHSTCPGTADCSGTVNTGGFTANYSCFSISAGNKCFIHAKGSFGSASVVKTSIVPAGTTASYGAITIRDGGVLQMGGSSSIVNCDAGCATPGVVYGGSVTLQLQDTLHNTTTCPNNPRGIYGGPFAVANGQGQQANCPNPANCSFSSAVLPDLVPTVFNSTDINDLKSDLGGAYNGYTVDVANRTVAGLPTRSAIPATTCTCTNLTFTLTAASTSCTGVASFAACNGKIRFNGTGTLTINAIPAGITDIVAQGNISVTGVSAANGNFAGKSLYTTAGKTITVNDGDVNLSNAKLVSGAGVTVTSAGTISNTEISSSGGGNVVLTSTGNISNATIISAGSITSDSNTTSIGDSIMVAEGSGGITIQSDNGISNSMIVTTDATADITIQGTDLSGSTLVTKDTITIQDTSGTISNTNMFSNSTVIQKGGGNIGGGVLYSAGNTTIQGTGGGTQEVGTEANPTLLLTGGDLVIQHSNGTTEFNGLVFANGRITYQANGNYEVNGAMMANSATQGSVFQGGGNASVNFNDTILNLLANNLGGRMKPPACGGGGSKAPYISATKVTVY